MVLLPLAVLWRQFESTVGVVLAHSSPHNLSPLTAASQPAHHTSPVAVEKCCALATPTHGRGQSRSTIRVLVRPSALYQWVAPWANVRRSQLDISSQSIARQLFHSPRRVARAVAPPSSSQLEL